MASGISGPQYRLEGLREFQKTCRKAGLDMDEFARAGERAGQIVASAGLFHVPIVSGNLASTIRPSRQKARVVVSAGSSAVPYANPIHWGWPAHNIRANPFLSDAARQTEPQWTAVYLEDLNVIISKIHGA